MHWELNNIDIEKEFHLTPDDHSRLVTDLAVYTRLVTDLAVYNLLSEESVIVDTHADYTLPRQVVFVSGMGGIGMQDMMTSVIAACEPRDHWVDMFDDDESTCNNNSTPLFGKDPNKVFKKGRKKW